MTDLSDLANAADQTMHRPARQRGLPRMQIEMSPGQAFSLGFFGALGAWLAWAVLTITLFVILFVLSLWPFSGR